LIFVLTKENFSDCIFFAARRGGSGKALKVFSIEILSLVENLALHLHLTYKNTLGAFHNTEKLRNIIPPHFSSRCPSGESYEMEFPKGADTKPLRSFIPPWRALNQFEPKTEK